MTRLKLAVCTAAGYFLLIAVFGVVNAQLANGQTGQPPGRDVRVVNTESEPIPVSLAGAISGDVNVVNTPNVSVVNAPTVKVDRTDPLPIFDVDNSARQPYTVELRAGSQIPILPTGKRFVIEQISGQIHGFNIQFVELCTTASGRYGCHFFPVIPRGTRTDNGATVYVFSQLTRVYADPGSALTNGSFGGSTVFGANWMVSGHLVDVP